MARRQGTCGLYCFICNTGDPNSILFGEKIKMNSVAYKRERKQHERSGYEPGWSVPARRDLVPQPVAVSRSKCESRLKEHASDPPRNVFSHLDQLPESNPDFCLHFFLPWDKAS